MYYVRIDHLSDQDLSILGYTLVDQNDEFKLYQCYDGTEHIVEKNGAGKRYLYVDDVNDAIAMRSEAIIQLQPPARR